MKNFFKFLLGHDLSELTQGGFSFGIPVGLAGTLAGLLVVLLLVWILYRRTTVNISGRLKTPLILLKTLALAILLLCLLKPMLTSFTLVPQKGHLALIVDDTESMTIPDALRGRSRGAVAKDLLGGEKGFIAALQQRFGVQLYRFGSALHRISDPDALAFKEPRTSLSQAFTQVAGELAGWPASGIVLITDGGDNSGEDLVSAFGLLKSLSIPVFVVGVGQEKIPKDHEIVQVTAARSILADETFDVRVTVASRGYEDRELDLVIEADGKVISSKRVRPGKTDTSKRHTLQIIPDREGTLLYTVRIPVETDEMIGRNNQWPLLVNNVKRRPDLLYVEGHPRNEYKFIRRAAENDKALRLATYLQTGPRKFLRQGIEAPGELAAGYPATAKDLFKYEAVIFGDISKTFFTTEQLDLTREFVSKRGGGFLMIGGVTAFEDSFIGTPVEDLLPVRLVPQAALPPQLRSPNGGEPAGEKYTLQLTAEGRSSALLRLALEDERNRQLWENLPQLKGIHVTGGAKPGATVLAVHPSIQNRGVPLPVIAYQRYGRGRTLAVTTGSTWRWQMLLSKEDTSHERLWRQILRWLTAASPDPVEITMDREFYSPGDAMTVRVRVADETYALVNDATVWLKITGPEKTVREIELIRKTGEEGIYLETFTVPTEGVFSLEVSASAPQKELPDASLSFLVSASGREYTDAGMNASLLNDIARISGGSFYTAENADDLIDDVLKRQNTFTVKREKNLWDMPLVLLLLLTFFSLEWFIRRQRGMS